MSLHVGVLPLTFHPGTTRITLRIDGTELFDVCGVPSVGAVLDPAYTAP